MPPRGSKKITVPVVAPAPAPAAAAVPTTEEPVTPVTPDAKKSRKKPVKVVAIVTPDGIEGSFSAEPRRPLIAHLQIKTSEVQFGASSGAAGGQEPEPYDVYDGDFFTSGQEPVAQAESAATPVNIATGLQQQQQKPERKDTPLPCFTKAKLMAQFKGASDAKCLPDTTDVACFWCVHPFETMPCVIPEREVAGVYMVYGNFCCPQCAMAYLLSENVDPHVRWERMALLQRVYDRSGARRIFPAAARESLQLFGGPMSIESYRATVQEGAVRVDLHMPPMVSILGSIDTKPIDFFDTSMKNTMTGVPTEKLQKAEEGLRLKRTKPLKDKESTLDTVMNIQIGSRQTPFG